jgi:hypothetical protein
MQESDNTRLTAGEQLMKVLRHLVSRFLKAFHKT